MDVQTFIDGGYEINHSNYSGNYGGDDTVCQVKRYNNEIAHCTWHPGKPEPHRHGSCPYRGGVHCLDR